MADDFEPQEETEEGAPEWMVTFADMMSLLLTFFILLLSFATMDAKKFQMAADSMREAFSFTALPIPGKARPQTSNGASEPTTQTFRPRRQRSRKEQVAEMQHSAQTQVLQAIKQQVDSYIRQEDLEAFVKTELGDRGLMIVNSDPLSFPSAGADLSDNSIQYLDALLPIISKSDFDVLIEGHTDNQPIRTSEFASNWELSTARASRFARYLIERGINPERLSVHGYAEFRPVAPNNSEANRAKNRRIEILLGYPNTDGKIAGLTGY